MMSLTRCVMSDLTITFEAKGGEGPESLAKALALLKKEFAYN